MPQIKTLSLNNGSSEVEYAPAAKSNTSVTFVNRSEGSLDAVSSVVSSHPAVTPGQKLQKQTLRLSKNKEVVVQDVAQKANVGLFNLDVTFPSTGTSRAERLAALNEFKAALTDPDIVDSIVDNEAFI